VALGIGLSIGHWEGTSGRVIIEDYEESQVLASANLREVVSTET
jgi:hypothetical protein